MSTSSVARTRRWIRECTCTSDDAIAIHNLHVEKLINLRMSIEASLIDKKRNYDEVLEYEKQRLTKADENVTLLIKDIQEGHQTFSRYKTKLTNIKQVIVEYHRFNIIT
jgi:hypothetical protein